MGLPSILRPIFNTFTMSVTESLPAPVARSDVMLRDTTRHMSWGGNNSVKLSPPWNSLVSSSTVATPGPGVRCLVWHSTQTPIWVVRYLPRSAESFAG